jgi:hypothetical protein
MLQLPELRLVERLLRGEKAADEIFRRAVTRNTSGGVVTTMELEKWLNLVSLDQG